jgi:hypothetical protein
MKALPAAAEELPISQQPKRLVVITTTGIDSEKKDVPLLFRPMYYYLLHVPHEDRKIIEKMIKERSKNVFPRRFC